MRTERQAPRALATGSESEAGSGTTGETKLHESVCPVNGRVTHTCRAGQAWCWFPVSGFSTVCMAAPFSGEDSVAQDSGQVCPVSGVISGGFQTYTQLKQGRNRLCLYLMVSAT